MCLKKQIKTKTIFLDYPVPREQNKQIAGNIYSTQMRKKQTAKRLGLF